MKVCLFHDPNPGQWDRKLFEIVEHAYNNHASVLVFTATTERAAAIDRFLWILKQESFMPHRVFDKNEPDPTLTIAIVASEMNPLGSDILIADGHCSIEFACSFDTVHEVVNRSSPEMQEACRDRYRAYRDRKLPVEHVKE